MKLLGCDQPHSYNEYEDNMNIKSKGRCFYAKDCDPHKSMCMPVFTPSISPSCFFNISALLFFTNFYVHVKNQVYQWNVQKNYRTNIFDNEGHNPWHTVLCFLESQQIICLLNNLLYKWLCYSQTVQGLTTKIKSIFSLHLVSIYNME